MGEVPAPGRFPSQSASRVRAPKSAGARPNSIVVPMTKATIAGTMLASAGNANPTDRSTGR